MNGLGMNIKPNPGKWKSEVCWGLLGKVSSSSKSDTGKGTFLPLLLLHPDEEPGAVAAMLCPWGLPGCLTEMAAGRWDSKFFFFLFFNGHTCSIWKLALGVESMLQLRPMPQPQQHPIRATSVTYAAACSNNRSLTQWSNLHPHGHHVEVLTHWAPMRTPIFLMRVLNHWMNPRYDTILVLYFMLYRIKHSLVLSQFEVRFSVPWSQRFLHRPL